MNIDIHVREENQRLPVSKAILTRVSKLTFQLTKKEAGDISLVVCDDKFITMLNQNYRGRPNPTDVLSFAMRDGEFSELSQSLLGDVIISVETAEKHALELNRSLKEEFVFLYVHGLLHLLGYTHDSRNGERVMMNYSEQILSIISGDL